MTTASIVCPLCQSDAEVDVASIKTEPDEGSKFLAWFRCPECGETCRTITDRTRRLLTRGAVHSEGVRP